MQKMNYFTGVSLFILVILLEANCSPFHRRPSLLGRPPRTSSHIFRSPPSYETRYFEQRLDHFNVGDDRTFQQRYLYSSGKWDGKGPLFVYTGNEGDIAWFYNNTVSDCSCCECQCYVILFCAAHAHLHRALRGILQPPITVC